MRWFIIPYIDSISEKFKTKVTKDLNSNLSFFNLNKLQCVIKAHKDPLPASSKKNIIYKISCNDCDATYERVDQTCRQLKTRISEHKNHIRRCTSVL